MGDILNFPEFVNDEISVEELLHVLQESPSVFKTLVVVGVTHEDGIFIGGTTNRCNELNYVLDLGKMNLLAGSFAGEE